GNGSLDNKFFPSLGNHDWQSGSAPYTNYFTLPGNGYSSSSGNERYYDFVIGNIHFYSYDSDGNEPDGRTLGSTQANWLQGALAASTSQWNFVFMHHPPYSSANHGDQTAVQLPYKLWGADAVFAGHDHTYERIILDDFPYFVTGLGGRSIYSFGTPTTGSEVRYNQNYGAMKVVVDDTTATFQFYALNGFPGGALTDTYIVVIPEPATMLVLGLGLVPALLGRARRR
ncbi:hypothetical protein LCGC14_2497710, partial [marine sediment metagenome]